MIKLKYRKYPEFVKAMANRHIAYNEALEYIEKKEAAGEILVIRPDEALPVSRVEKDTDKLKLAYEIGRQAAKINLEKIKSFLK